MIEHVLAHTIPAALALLPLAMDSPNARAMLLAIGRQESRFEHRRQVRGPARGFWQFELLGGVTGVVEHKATKAHAAAALERLRYAPAQMPPLAVHAALEHNDTLACCFARLLLYTLPQPLPGPQDAEAAWQQYLAAWRPGKPHRPTWAGHYADAWGRVTGGPT